VADIGYAIELIALNTFNRTIIGSAHDGNAFDIPEHPRVQPVTARSILATRLPRLACVGAMTTSLAALKLMAKLDIGAVLVADGDHALGIFSEHHYARPSALFEELAPTIPVCEAVTRCDVYAVPDDSAHACLTLMHEKHLLFLPVKQDSNFVDMLLMDELLNELLAHHQKILKANKLDQQAIFLLGTFSC
jgi:CBS domain-containing protein